MFSNLPDMETKEFTQWQALLEQRTGLWLPESRKAFLLTALSNQMRNQGANCYQELYKKFSSGAVSLLDWASLVDAVTVHETCYYRDKNSLNLVTSYCRNKILEELRENAQQVQHLQIWSVGCSTGEEVYSLAIELDKLTIGLAKDSQSKVYYGVTGIDISYPSLAVAREGIYAEKQLEFIPAATRNFYFHRLEDGYYQIKQSIRQRTCFVQGNILELEEKTNQLFDVIYCQNVMIYFRQEGKQKVIEQLTERLKPGGLLILGHGEIINVDNELLTRLDSKNSLAFLRRKF